MVLLQTVWQSAWNLCFRVRPVGRTVGIYFRPLDKSALEDGRQQIHCIVWSFVNRILLSESLKTWHGPDKARMTFIVLQSFEIIFLRFFHYVVYSYTIFVYMLVEVLFFIILTKFGECKRDWPISDTCPSLPRTTVTARVDGLLTEILTGTSPAVHKTLICLM